MPKVKPQTFGEGISDEEAEEMVRRMITGAEDLLQIYDADEWDEFVTSKLFNEQNQFTSEGQFDVIKRGRSFLIDEMTSAGFRGEEVIRLGKPVATIRDMTTGQFTSWANVQKEIVPFKPW